MRIDILETLLWFDVSTQATSAFICLSERDVLGRRIATPTQ
jgi:hypothetical protein